MSLQKICKMVVRLSSTRSLSGAEILKRGNTLAENSAEYSSDGEKIHCGLKFTEHGQRTEEELSMIVESARAKAFDDSLKNVVTFKIEN